MRTVLAQTVRAAILAGAISSFAVQPGLVSAQNAPQTVNLGAVATSTISFPKGSSTEFDLHGQAAGSVVAANSDVVEVVMLTPTRFTLLGKGYGRSTVSVSDTTGRLIQTVQVQVDPDVASAQASLARILPEFRGHVIANGSGFALTGQAASAKEAADAEAALKNFAGKDAGVFNALTLSGPQMVTVKAQIVEVQRSVIKQLGFDTSALIGQVGRPQYLFSNLASFGVNGSLLGGISGGYKLDTQKQPVLGIPCSDPSLTGCYTIANEATSAANYETAAPHDTAGSPGLNQAQGLIKAFERNGLFRTVDEPTVTTASGETGSLNSGGSFPVPTGKDASGQVTITFKDYGVNLQVTPTVLSGGMISLKIHTGVNEVSSINGFTLSTGGSSLVVPGTIGNNSDSTVTLASGEAIMSSSLLKQDTKEDIDSIPGVAELPGPLGMLLRSRDYQQGDKELVVIITATLASGTDPARLQTPADNLQFAGDLQTTLLGRLNVPLKQPPGQLPRPYQGPIGYVIE
ncbi:MAG: type and secretion system protein [Caulobacteraceae bacterium]|nr:type and secretion system protein [Caulobacteraceae bacterium]